MNKIGKIQLSRFQIGLDEKLHTNFLCKCKTLNNISYSCFPLQHLLNMHLVATNPKFHFPFSARVERKDKGRDAKESLGTQVSHPWLNTPTRTDRRTESRDGR